MSARLLAPVGGQLLRSSNRRDRTPGRANLSVRVAAAEHPVSSAALSETSRLRNSRAAAVSGAERLVAPAFATAREADDWREWLQFFEQADAQDRVRSTLQVRFWLSSASVYAGLRRSCVPYTC
jgi:hypothetical protein